MSIHRTFIWILILFLASCSSGEITDLEYPLGEIKQTTQSFFNHTLKEIEPGGRDYRSEYFRPNLSKGRIESPRSEDRVRAKALVRFIGNERPYSIEIWVDVETKDRDVWTNQGTDKNLSKKLARQLQDFIQSRREKNVIDHFRPF